MPDDDVSTGGGAIDTPSRGDWTQFSAAGFPMRYGSCRMKRTHQSSQCPSLFRPALLTAALLWLAPNLAAQITTHTVSAGPDTVTVTVKATVTGKKAAVIVKDPIFNRRVDTVRVGDTVPPPPPTGTTYFLADAEAGDMTPWSLPWGLSSNFGNPVPSNSPARAYRGARAYKYEITNPVEGASSMTLVSGPQSSMGGGFRSGYYSTWAYLDAGYTAPGWNMLVGWMTNVSGKPSPIGNIGVQVWRGTLQLMFQAKNATFTDAQHPNGCYPAPQIPGYENASNGWYYQTAGSPNGITAVPRGRWVQVVTHYEMAPRPNGRVRIWQDGTLVMDLAGLDTFNGHSIEPCQNSGGGMILQVGIYGGAKTDGVQRLFLDDFRVSDYRPVP